MSTNKRVYESVTIGGRGPACTKHKLRMSRMSLLRITHPEEPPNHILSTLLSLLPSKSISTTTSAQTNQKQDIWHSRHTRYCRHFARQQQSNNYYWKEQPNMSECDDVWQSVRRYFDFVYRSYHPWMIQIFLILTLFVFGNLSAWQENIRPKLYVELGKYKFLYI